MTKPTIRYKSWNTCVACGYEGVFTFRSREDEDYDDPEALGVMLDATCPACEQDEAVLVTIEQFQEMSTFSQESE